MTILTVGHKDDVSTRTMLVGQTDCIDGWS